MYLSCLYHIPMKHLVFYALLALSVPSLGQGTSSKTLKPLPDYIYITPDMTKKQVDSIIAVLDPYNLSLGFDTLEYGDNNMIKKVNGSLYAKDEYFLVSSANFKGMTIINKGGRSYVVMGLYYPPKEK